MMRLNAFSTSSSLVIDTRFQHSTKAPRICLCRFITSSLHSSFYLSYFPTVLPLLNVFLSIMFLRSKRRSLLVCPSDLLFLIHSFLLLFICFVLLCISLALLILSCISSHLVVWYSTHSYTGARSPPDEVMPLMMEDLC